MSYSVFCLQKQTSKQKQNTFPYKKKTKQKKNWPRYKIAQPAVKST